MKATFPLTELPVIQAPMAGVQGSELTIAVCQAGGLGSLPCGMLSAAQISEALQTITAATAKPYNLNFFCHRMPAFDAQRQARWQGVLKGYFAQFGAEPDSSAGGASRLPFSHEIADVVEPFAPPVVSFHFGLPAPDLLQRVKGWGALVMSSATTVEEARWLEAKGADVLIAQGLEAGGHRGMFLSDDVTTQVGLAALLPQIVKAVSVPVVAAGGIADPLAVKAMRLCGASAVQVGTAYLLCPEATTSALHRRALSSERAEHTALTNVFSGRPARGIVNRVMRELHYLNPQVPDFPYASAEISRLRALAEQGGSDDFSPLWCGQNAHGCREAPAAQVTRWLAGV
ncbi:nitronate monooxygenase [Granulosicoccaceae sp. 1_MG-2023]|nr:nitronate monooxygenase [Granulosicoccaceae sp. 1_MG-2023]